MRNKVLEFNVYRPILIILLSGGKAIFISKLFFDLALLTMGMFFFFEPWIFECLLAHKPKFH